MSELSNRQLRALAQACPFYPAAEGHGSQADELAGTTPSDVAGSAVPPREEWLQEVVPRVAKTFPDCVRAYQQRIETVPSNSGDGEKPHTGSSSLHSAAVDAVLRFAFNATSSMLPSPSAQDAKRRARAATCFAEAGLTPLSPRELQLLRLYQRKQEQYAHVASTQQQLLAASRSAVQALQLASAAAQGSDGDGTALISARQRGTEESLITSARESMSFLGEANASSAWAAPPAASPTFTSILARVPYAEPRAHQAAGAVNGNTVFASTADGGGAEVPEPQRSGHNSPPPPTLMIVHRCAGCHEAGGDLLVCTQCSEVRHEACGGPHPPEPSSVDGRMPTVNVCRQCAKALNLSSSSSSLRSSTSSSERAALDEYFSSDSDGDSSLSGFIVHTSEEDDEAANEEAEGRERSTERATSPESADRSNEGKEDPHSRRSRHPPARVPPRNGTTTGTAPARQQRNGTARGRRDEVDSSADASPGSSTSSSQVWSRSASLDRALAAAAAATSKEKKKKKAAARREDGGRAADKAAPATRRAAARRGGERSDPEDEEEKGSTSVAGKRQRREETSDTDAFSARTPPTKRQQSKAGQLPSTSNATSASASPASAAAKAKARPAIVLEEEEELGVLGLSKSSPASPEKRKSGGKGGRRSVVNVASSSSSSSTDGSCD